jgi:CubicO group peptidase (beta-lactamase class C family)
VKAILLFLFVVLTVQASTCPLPLRPSFSLNQKEQIDNLILNYKKKYKLEQIQLLVGDSKDILLYNRYNSKKNTLFDLASITKVFSALTLLKIFEDKKIFVNDHISSFFSEFDTLEKRHLSFEDILRHTSGYKAGVGSGVLVAHNSARSFENIFKLFPTRSYNKFLYSDINYLLVGEFIKRLSGMDLDKSLKKYITLPLGLNRTLYRPHTNKLNECAPTRKDQKTCYVHDPTSFTLGGLTGHAGIFSSALDLARFARLFLNQGKECGKEIISQSIVSGMTVKRPHKLRGLGFDISSPYARRPRGEYFTPDLSFGHTGFTGTSMWIDPVLDTYMIVLTNTVNAKNEHEAKRGYLNLLIELSSIIGKFRSEI